MISPTLPSRLAVLLTALALQLQAALKPAEQLLPADTLGVVTFPDLAKSMDSYAKSPMGVLWNDASMKPFRDKLMGKLRSDVLTPFEQQSGIKLADYENLPQGQFTFAVIQNGWDGKADKLPALLILLDTRDKSDQLQKNLADLKKKWVDAGKPIKTEKIRDVEFNVLSLDLAAVTEADDNNLPKIDFLIGQHESALVIGTSAAVIEKVLARQGGGSIPFLAEVPAFEADHKLLFRDASSYGWIHFAPLATVLNKILSNLGESGDANPMTPKPDKIVAALGLLEIRTLAVTGRQTSEGGYGDLYIGLPADKRKGIFKMLAHEAKSAGPPPFVPADATEFSRWRLDGQKLWASLESLVNEIAPGMLGFVMAQMESALKEKDPNFDFRKNLIGNLGDDIISYKKAPRGSKPDDLANQPGVTLIGSPNAGALIQALRSLILVAPPMLAGIEFQERDFLGRKIYSVPVPSAEGERKASFCASGGYLAISLDTPLLEEYLRSADSKAKPLSETTGLTEAASKVGGMDTGLFIYQNDAETTRVALEMFKNHGGLIEEGLSQMLAENAGAEDVVKKIKEWVDVSLLPSWDKIAKYFSFSVMAGRTDANGLRLGVYTPNPAGFKP